MEIAIDADGGDLSGWSPSARSSLVTATVAAVSVLVLGMNGCLWGCVAVLLAYSLVPAAWLFASLWLDRCVNIGDVFGNSFGMDTLLRFCDGREDVRLEDYLTESNREGGYYVCIFSLSLAIASFFFS